MIVKHYYTLNELCSEIVGTKKFSTLFSYWDLSYTEGTSTVALFDHISEDVGDENLFILIVEIDPWASISRPSITELKTNYKSQVQSFLNKLKSWLDDTSFKYEKLISLYTAQESHLLDQIESVSTSQFNDTPQTTSTGLDSDSYASTYTKNKTSVDNGSVINRLNEVRNYYNSIFGEWVSIFKRKFIIY